MGCIGTRFLRNSGLDSDHGRLPCAEKLTLRGKPTLNPPGDQVPGYACLRSHSRDRVQILTAVSKSVSDQRLDRHFPPAAEARTKFRSIAIRSCIAAGVLSGPVAQAEDRSSKSERQPL